MARKSLTERRADALAELEAARKRLAKLESDAAERLGKLALKAGLADLPEEALAKEFAAIADRFQAKPVPARQSKATAGEG